MQRLNIFNLFSPTSCTWSQKTMLPRQAEMVFGRGVVWFCLQGLGDRGKVDSHIGSVPPKRSWKQMLITLPCASVKTPKSVREVKSDNISCVSPRPCSAARFAPLLSPCCLLPHPPKVSSERLVKGVNPCSSGSSQCHIACCFSHLLGHLRAGRASSYICSCPGQAAGGCLVSLGLFFTSSLVVVRKCWFLGSKNFIENNSKLHFIENKWEV